MGENPSKIWTWIVPGLAALAIWAGVHWHAHRLAREGLYPYENAWNWVRRIAVAPFDYWNALRGDVEHRQALEAALVLARAQQMEAEVIAHENATLRRLLDMRQSAAGHYRVFSVLARGDAAGWWQILRIAGGERDGLRPHQPVLAPEGLIGRITAVGTHSSDVLLITDPNSRIACRIESGGPGTRGIVFGGGSHRHPAAPHLSLLMTLDPLFLRFLDRNTPIPVGARVVTSGDGDVFPAGLPVGIVTASRLEPDGLYHEADVAPMTDPWSLTHVMVRIPEPRHAP